MDQFVNHKVKDMDRGSNHSHILIHFHEPVKEGGTSLKNFYYIANLSRYWDCVQKHKTNVGEIGLREV